MASHGYDFAPVLHSELGRISAHFAENELAFLALTSKVELPIRDRLAFRLFCRYRDFYLVREWKRVDLAVLSGGPTPAPLMLLEAKALYTFDLVGDDAWIARYPAKVGQDVGKLRGFTDLTTGTQLFALVLATHPTGPIEPNLRQVAKYASGVGKAIETQGHANAVAAKA